MTTSAHASMRNVYLGVFGALLALTLATVGVSYLHLPRTEAIALALIVAGIKVSLIGAFFMHLKSEGKIIHGLLYTALVFLSGLLFLTLTDIVRTHPQ